MPLIFPAEIAWVAMIAAVGAYLLYRTETMWLRPLVLALQHPHGSWWKRVVLKPLALVPSANSITAWPACYTASTGYYAARSSHGYAVRSGHSRTSSRATFRLCDGGSER